MKIIWTNNTNSTISEGYGYASHHIFNQLTQYQDLNICDANVQLDTELSMSPVNLGYAVSKKFDCDILINCSLPDAYNKCDGYNIGFSYWETDQLPRDWVIEMNKMDEIWTTSQWAKNVFINSGVTQPVFAFELGVDPKLYYPSHRGLSGSFSFLSIGSPSTRKNSQMVVDAFLSLFEGKEGYRLIYKSSGPPDARIGKGSGNMRSLYGHEQIEVIDDILSDEDLAKLYDRANCLVYPTSGEGWGMIPFQAIMKGIPTICTKATACREYADLSVPLKYSWSNRNLFGIYSGNGCWAAPNFTDLCDKMLYVVNNYNNVADFTYKNAMSVHERYSWESVTKDYYNRLCQILSNIKKRRS
jgi:glycosyltransferase involved in cell wall biosynthesis